MVKSLRFIQATAFVYLLSLVFFQASNLPNPVVLLGGLIFMIFWLGFPYALYKDRIYLSREYGWESSKLHYLGFLPSIIGLLFILNYLWKRDKNVE